MITYFKNSKLSESSEKKHNQFLNKWVDLIPNKSLEYLILFPAHSLTILQKYLKQRDNENPTSKYKSLSKTNIHSYISATLALFKHSPEYLKDIPQVLEYHNIWINIVNYNQHDIVTRRNNNKPTELQAMRGGSKLTLQNIVNKRDEDNLNIVHKLLLSMYTMIPPVRVDYYATQFVKEGTTPTSDNYIILKTGEAELVIRKYKTAKRHGDITYSKLPDELYSVITKSLEENPRDYLFVNTKNTPFTRHDFSIWCSKTLNKIFGVELTLTMLRHIYISYTDFNQMTLAERKDLGAKMGHTVQMQLGYEWK